MAGIKKLILIEADECGAGAHFRWYFIPAGYLVVLPSMSSIGTRGQNSFTLFLRMLDSIFFSSREIEPNPLSAQAGPAICQPCRVLGALRKF